MLIWYRIIRKSIARTRHCRCRWRSPSTDSQAPSTRTRSALSISNSYPPHLPISSMNPMITTTPSMSTNYGHYRLITILGGCYSILLLKSSSIPAPTLTLMWILSHLSDLSHQLSHFAIPYTDIILQLSFSSNPPPKISMASL